MINICIGCKADHKKSHHCIQLSKKKDYCCKHDRKFKFFCIECQENICEREIKEKEHKNHEIIEINQNNEINRKYYNIIKKTNEELTKIIEFNKLVINTGETLNHNYYHLKSIINLAKSLKEGNERNSMDVKCLLNGLSKGIEYSNIAIDSLIKKKKIQLSRNDKYIHLSDGKIKLEDIDFEYISQIKFNQLIEIDISNNNITKVDPFKEMSLPFLEFLNLSHNHINKIEPIINIKSKQLEYVFLQNNQIKDIETFYDFPKYPKALKILRIEDNTINGENEEEKKEREDTLKKLEKKYSGKFIYKSISEQKKNFKMNYKLDKEISEDDEIIDIHDLNCGDKIMKDLFLIITYNTKNNVNKLILRNNKIKDPSILKRINFNKLQTLDLAVNEITNLNFLLDMKAENLQYLYLDNNYFNDIYPLLAAKFPYLETLSLNKNYFDCEIMSKSPGYIELFNKKMKNGKNIYIQLEEDKKLNEELNKNAKNANNGNQPNEINDKENISEENSPMNPSNENRINDINTNANV
jgi:Leucine-rich repeat (LRR) protein